MFSQGLLNYQRQFEIELFYLNLAILALKQGIKEISGNRLYSILNSGERAQKTPRESCSSDLTELAEAVA